MLVIFEIFLFALSFFFAHLSQHPKQALLNFSLSAGMDLKISYFSNFTLIFQRLQLSILIFNSLSLAH
jgi:hypothetical protein